MAGIENQPRPSIEVPLVGLFREVDYSAGDLDPLTLVSEGGSETYDFSVAPISLPAALNRLCAAQRPPELAPLAPNFAFQLEELFITGPVPGGGLLGITSTCIRLDRDTSESRLHTLLLQKEVEWASHLGIRSVFLPAITAESQFKCLPNYARVVNQMMANLSQIQYILPIHIGVNEPKDANPAWRKWNLFRNLCTHRSLLKMALVLPETGKAGLNELIPQWYGEPLSHVFVPAGRFIPNRKGCPVLSKADQRAFRGLFAVAPQFVVVTPREPLVQHTCGGTAPLKAYGDYIRHLASRVDGPINSCSQDGQKLFDSLAQGYSDYLQAPLQPLMDQLESATYEVFEKDPVKYQLYEQAVYRALLDLGGAQSPIVIVVAGAGRGPLVDRCLKAAETARLPIKLYAVEKNPNAFVTLQRRKAQDWQDRVAIFFSDMRGWAPPEKADILVTELLGSFGDNELSPECLDGAQGALKAGGISIPSEYSSYLAPMASARLHESIAAYNDLSKFEVPYVVMFQQARLLAPPLKAWTFTHPHGELIDASVDNRRNDRYASCRFKFPSATEGVVHGLAGYFEATLYKEVAMSIHPTTHSPGMFSWFPLFFPLAAPIHVTPGSELEVHIWRCSAPALRRVWYEWCAIPEGATLPSGIHNPNGRAYWIGL
ncbi:hypothetical protein L0F63_007469 [Massospora cicadina]|nr:hypothetical protein L0F63_007469 [Massospora cicadina]